MSDKPGDGVSLTSTAHPVDEEYNAKRRAEKIEIYGEALYQARTTATGHRDSFTRMAAAILDIIDAERAEFELNENR